MKQQFLSLPSTIIILFAILVTTGFLVWENNQMAYQISTPSASPIVSTPSVSVSPVPVDVSNWKTYRNETYGFEMKYPLGWNIREADTDTFSLLIFDPPEVKSLMGSIRLFIFTQTTESLDSQAKVITLEERLKEVSSFLHIHASQEKKILVDGKDRTEFQTTRNPFFLNSTSLINAVLTSANQKGYLLAYSPSDPYWDSYESIFHEVVSTFRSY